MSEVIKKISEGVLYSSGSRIFIKIFSAIGYFLIINRLSIHDYGVFVLLIASLAPASTLVFFNFDRIFVSSISKARGEKNFGFIKGMVKEYFFVIFFALVVVFAISFGVHHFLIKNASWSLYFWPLGIFFVSQVFMNVVSLFLESNEKFKEISFAESVESVSRCFYLLLLAIFSHFSVVAVLVVYSLGKLTASGVSLYYALPLLVQLKKYPIIREKSVLKKIIKNFAKWEIARSILEQSIQPLRLWILKFFVNIEGVAIFEFARSMYGVVSSIIPMKKILFPIVSRFARDKEKAGLIIMKAKKVTFFANALFFVGLALTLPFLLPWFFPAYTAHYIFILFVLLHLFIDVYKLGQDAVIYAFQEQKFLFQVAPLFLILQLLVDIFSMKFFGVYGVVISWHLFAFLTGYFTHWYLFRKQHMKKHSWARYYRFDAYDRLILSKVFNRMPQKLQKFVPESFKVN